MNFIIIVLTVDLKRLNKIARIYSYACHQCHFDICVHFF